jgi:flagellar basal body-associated protein FliL
VIYRRCTLPEAFTDSRESGFITLIVFIAAAAAALLGAAVWYGVKKYKASVADGGSKKAQGKDKGKKKKKKKQEKAEDTKKEKRPKKNKDGKK